MNSANKFTLKLPLTKWNKDLFKEMEVTHLLPDLIQIICQYLNFTLEQFYQNVYPILKQHCPYDASFNLNFEHSLVQDSGKILEWSCKTLYYIHEISFNTFSELWNVRFGGADDIISALKEIQPQLIFARDNFYNWSHSEQIYRGISLYVIERKYTGRNEMQAASSNLVPRSSLDVKLKIKTSKRNTKGNRRNKSSQSNKSVEDVEKMGGEVIFDPYSLIGIRPLPSAQEIQNVLSLQIKSNVEDGLYDFSVPIIF